MSKALYRKYRSKSLDEIVGQEHITAILKRAIEKDKIAHAYLLTGPRGVGKTSIARILAHAINDLPYSEESQHLDIIEIDAASNNSVEDVRDLREKVQIAPVSAKRKVYIIDEVHMLSKQAFNALLKTLEEPPEHIVFILATTDADKLPATIISRVQRFNFRAISEQDAVKHLKAIAKKEHIAIDDAALNLIATHGKGSFRDSIGLLDQMQHVSDSAVTRDMVAQILGLADNDMITSLLNAYSAGDLQTVVTTLNTAAANGTPAHVIAEQLIRTIRDNIVAQPQLLPLLDDLLDVTKSAWPEIKLLTALTKQGRLGSDKVGKLKSDASEPTTPTAKAPRRSELDSEHADNIITHGLNQVQTDETQNKSEARGTRQEAQLQSHESRVTSHDNSAQATQGNTSLDKPSEPRPVALQKDAKDSSERRPAVAIADFLETEPNEAPGTTVRSGLRAGGDGKGRDGAVVKDNASNNEGKNDTTTFDWLSFTQAVKPKAAGAFVILKNCGHVYNGKTLVIYGGKKFNKTKLDKALPDLNAALTELGVQAEITITDTAKPPEDATTAAIIDMMGGGEELSAPTE